MKRKGKSIFFIVAALIFALSFTSFFGVKEVYGDKTKVWFKGASDIRFGIDIKGGPGKMKEKQDMKRTFIQLSGGSLPKMRNPQLVSLCILKMRST